MKKLIIDKTNFTNINQSLKDIKNNDYDIIYIKDSLSDNYMEFQGLLLAHHIRLSPELKEKRYLPIVIISPLDGMLINKLTSLSRILFTKNVFLNNLPNSYSPLDENNFKKEFIDKIVVDKPTDKSSNHDISNQWSIYQWAKFLDIQSEAIDKNENQIKDSLYFKYLIAKNNIKIGNKEVPTKKILKKSIGLKKIKIVKNSILYIDDEWDKGWGDIFDKYFSKKDNINFSIFKENFKDKNFNDIETKVIEYIKKIDIVLLDIRLLKDDHNKKQKIEELSGIKLLQKIKNINKGIQVIMLTASGKSETLDKLNNLDIVGYIKKTSPKDNNINPKEKFEKLQKLIDIGIDKKYLKDIFDIQQEILNIKNLSNEIKFEINIIFDILNSKLQNNIKFAIITIFKVFELIIKNYGNSEQSTYHNIKKILKNLNIEDDYLNKFSLLNCSRNYLIHTEIRPECQKHKNSILKLDEISEAKDTNEVKDNIITWFKMTKDILLNMK
jgi:CheY-like chemotaxis protein